MVAGRAGGYGGGDDRQQDQSPPHSLPRRPGPSSGLRGQGDDHAQAPGQPSDRAPGTHRGGTQAGRPSGPARERRGTGQGGSPQAEHGASGRGCGGAEESTVYTSVGAEEAPEGR